MNATGWPGRRRYSASVLISITLHASIALLLGLIIVSHRAETPLSFTAELVVVPPLRPDERIVKHRRVPRPLESRQALDDTRTRPNWMPTDRTYSQDVAESAVIGDWATASALVRPYDDLPPSGPNVAIRPGSLGNVAARPEMAQLDGRSAFDVPTAYADRLPGLATLLLARPEAADGVAPLPVYLDAIQARISKYQQYPRAALENGIEGACRVHFLIARDGRLLEVEIAESSGYRLLDDAATKTVRDAAPFPPFPEGQRGNSVPIEVKIIFQLKDPD